MRQQFCTVARKNEQIDSRSQWIGLAVGKYWGKGLQMLVLTRKANESIRIGNGIEITVTEIRGNRVRIGVKAPQSTPIYRGELQPSGEKPITGTATREEFAGASI